MMTVRFAASILTTAAVVLVVAACGESGAVPLTAPVVPVLVPPATNPLLAVK